MADLLGHVIALHAARQRSRDGQRRPGLAEAGNIVTLALDREQRGPLDRLGIDPPAAVAQLALWQEMALKHTVDRLQVELRRHDTDRAILVIESLGRIGALAVATDEMLVHLPMADEVIAEVHRHEAGELEKSGVNLAAGAAVIERHG